MTVATLPAGTTARRLRHGGEEPPRAGSKTLTSSQGSATPGKNELGTISIQDSVVAKLAARAAVENPDAGAAASTVLGLTLPGAGLLGTKSTDLDELPKSSATVDGSIATIKLTISVRWPLSVAKVAGEVRDHVRNRITELTGLDVTEVQIAVTDLATSIAPPPRVS